MEPTLQLYTERAQHQISDKNELFVIKAKLAWILKIKQCSGCSTDSQDTIDAELSARVLRIINATDSGLHSQRYGELSKQRLDQAILTFFQHFRKSYRQLYARLSELLGLQDHLIFRH